MLLSTCQVTRDPEKLHTFEARFIKSQIDHALLSEDIYNNTGNNTLEVQEQSPYAEWKTKRTVPLRGVEN